MPEPRQVELALEQHPSIAGAALGWLRLRGSTRWTAFVVARGPFEPGDLLRSLAESGRAEQVLPEEVLPEQVLVVDEIPRDACGVPRRAELAADESTVDTSELERAVARLARVEQR